MKICITGCHTGCGKTHVSGILCSILGFDYFKIIQAGEERDALKVQEILGFSHSNNLPLIHPDGVFLKSPISPHIAKKLENKHYNALEIPIPNSKNLIIETAGGILTPIDEKFTMLDFIKFHKLNTILVGKNYLGSINHILLSICTLKTFKINIMGLIITGDKDEDVNEFIKKKTNINALHLDEFNKKNFKKVRETFSEELRIQIPGLQAD